MSATVAAPVRVIGSYVSPYVRKALVFLAEKGIPYEIDPIVPFFGDDRFTALSPLRRVPVLIDDRVTLCDSSVICQYLEERHPEPALYPSDVAARAHARWLEELADTRLGDVFVWRLFNQLVIRRFVWNEEPDRALVERTLAEDVPQVLDYLESQAPATGFLCGDFSIADAAVASFFRNASFARFSTDASRWPRTAALVERTLARPSFQALAPLELCTLRTPLAEVRAALRAAAAPVSEETCGTATPRRGVMPV